MSTLTDRTISTLRAEHDRLIDLAASATSEQLGTMSGASEWTVAKVLSHLGSGAEIMTAELLGALGRQATPAEDFSRTVWARFDVAAPEQQRDWFIEHGGAAVTALEELTAEERETARISLGFFPAPLSIAAFGGLRLNELANHGWDVAVAFADDATIRDDTAQVVLDLFGSEIGFILGFAAKPDALAERVVLRVPSRDDVLRIDGSVSLDPADQDSTALFDGPPEALLRLINGRLTPAHTPDVIAVSGNLSLKQLRQVFPGF